jgi:hypothetical protein
MKWMRSIASGGNGGDPRLPSGRYGVISATRSDHGTTRSISPRNSRRRVGLVDCPKPELCCVMGGSSQVKAGLPSTAGCDFCRLSLPVTSRRCIAWAYA